MNPFLNFKQDLLTNEDMKLIEGVEEGVGSDDEIKVVGD